VDGKIETGGVALLFDDEEVFWLWLWVRGKEEAGGSDVDLIAGEGCCEAERGFFKIERGRVCLGASCFKGQGSRCFLVRSVAVLLCEQSCRRIWQSCLGRLPLTKQVVVARHAGFWFGVGVQDL
jgi:hypothetical protein